MTFGPRTESRPPSTPGTGSSAYSMPGRKRPTVPARMSIGVLVGEHGARLRRAVALEHLHAELVRPDAARLVLELFGAGEHVAHAVEIVRMRETRVAREERVRAEHACVAFTSYAISGTMR